MAMDFLQQIMGGRGDEREQYRDFVERYGRGAPWEGISDREAYDRYEQVAPRLPRDEYVSSATEAFARLSPDERREFGRFLQERASQRGVSFSDYNGDGMDDRYQDPRYLAQMTGRVREEQPGLLEQVLGGGGGRGDGGSMLSNPIAKAAMAGIAAMAVKRVMGR